MTNIWRRRTRSLSGGVFRTVQVALVEVGEWADLFGSRGDATGGGRAGNLRPIPQRPLQCGANGEQEQPGLVTFRVANAAPGAPCDAVG
ncbi:MAG: hypothetical protein ACR2HR_11080 [Euzebya sp.]